jgi:hypothetical protein
VDLANKTAEERNAYLDRAVKGNNSERIYAVLTVCISIFPSSWCPVDAEAVVYKIEGKDAEALLSAEQIALCIVGGKVFAKLAYRNSRISSGGCV